jgi:hypothetical protein
MAIRARLTEFFGVQHPIVLAPMRRISTEATARLALGRQNQFVGEAGAAAERT